MKKARLNAGPERVRLHQALTGDLRAPTRTPTTPAPIARPIPSHDAAAEAACRSVAQIDYAGQRVSGVH